MAGLSYHQKEEITRLRAAEMTPGDIAGQMGLDEAAVRSALLRRKLRGFFGLVGIFGFFSAIIVTPLLLTENLEGEPITDVTVMQRHLPGEWFGYWMTRGHKRPLRLLFAESAPDSWSLKMIADDENCPGTGAYSGSGTISAKGISGRLVAAHPDCGELDITYLMALNDEGKAEMKGQFLRMPTGDVGEHFVTRE